MIMIRKVFQYLFIPILAMLSALNYAIFIFPNTFAPSGVDGICTMIQYITKISMGYLSLLVNIPLLVIGYKMLGHEFTLKTTIYVFSFSLSTICLQNLDISNFVYFTNTSIALAPIAAGTIRGILYVYTLKQNSSSGGTDIIGAILKHIYPHYNFMNIIFFINMFIAICSYFVYDFQAEPVICSIIYAFITSTISNYIQAKRHKMVKFEIITPINNDLCCQIFNKFHQTATKMEAKGAYSGKDMEMIICVVERHKAHYMEEMLEKMSNTVFFISEVNDRIG